jgi:hypothetical protein
VRPAVTALGPRLSLRSCTIAQHTAEWYSILNACWLQRTAGYARDSARTVAVLDPKSEGDGGLLCQKALAEGKVASLAEAVQTLKDEEQRLKKEKAELRKDPSEERFCKAPQLHAIVHNLQLKREEIKAQEAQLEQFREAAKQLALREEISQIKAEFDLLFREQHDDDDTDMELRNCKRLCDLQRRLEECEKELGD